MNDVNIFLNGINLLISNQDGHGLVKEISLPLSNPKSAWASQNLVERIRGISNFSNFCSKRISDSRLAGVIYGALSALVSVVEHDSDSAFKHELVAYNAVLDYFGNRDEDTTWIIPVLVRISNDLRGVAQMVDDRNRDINFKMLRESLGFLTRGFTIVAKERTSVTQQGSKKLAIFAVTNVLFKIYFKVNTLQLCGKLINVVEGPGGIMDNLFLFPTCDVVMYKYYIGRLKMFEDRYEEARECLRFALKFTPASSIKNRQRILASLIPVEMCLGVLPKQEVASRYHLPELFSLGQAVKAGDIKTFENVLEQHQVSFIRIGVYLVLEQVKLLVFRNLVRRVYLICGNTRLNLFYFQAIFNSLGLDSDLDEIECILSNLIYHGKIKGYISHEKRFLILSKTDPFPVTAVIKKF